MRIIGSLAHIHLSKEERSKFQLKILKCIMAGYDNKRKVYRLYYLPKRKILLSKDVVFDESKIRFEFVKKKEKNVFNKGTKLFDTTQNDQN